MSTLRTYKRAVAAAALALALALACVGIAPAVAWASVAGGSLGINVEVPSTIEQRPGAGDPDPGKRPGSAAVLGVNLQVPQAPEQTPGGDAGSQTGAAGAVLGINLAVPPTIDQATGGDGGKTGASAVLGVNLSVPDPVPDPDDPDNPGAITGDKTSGASAVLGINLNVPSTVEQATGEASGSESVLGVNLKVPVSEMVTFYGNGGRGTVSASLVPGQEIGRPDDAAFYWPGHHIVGWYVDAACTGDPVSFPLTEDVLKEHRSFYAKWEADDPRAVGAVELHLVEHEFEDATGAPKGNDTFIADDERETHGIVGDGGEPDGYVEAADADELGGPVYEGRYYVGGDAEVWPDGASNDAAALDGGTLVLPTPEMRESADCMRSGWFDGWYKSCEPVVDAAGQPVLDETGYPAYRYTDPVRKVGEQWVIDRFDEGTGEGGEPAYGQVLYAKWATGQKQTVTFHANGGAWKDAAGASIDVVEVAVKRGEPVSASDIPAAPEREGHAFHSWRVGSLEGPMWSASSKVWQDTELYASWSRVEHVVAFDAAGGSAVSPRKVPHGERVAEPATARPGYELLGWWLDADGDGSIGDDEERYDFSTPVTAPIRLMARWQEKGPDPVVEYEVRFDLGYEGAPTVPPQTVQYGRVATRPAPDPEREGYEFRGWRTAADGAGEAWDFATPITEAHVGAGSVLTLYADWHAPEELTVTFDAGRGAFEGAGAGGADAREVAVAVMEGEPVAPPEAAPKRAGWQFAGWHVAGEDAQPGDWDGDGASVVPLGEPWDFEDAVASSMTLHARWSLRLDVTVPVSVAFAVDASTGEATPPDPGRYALKSRTVREVEVESAALRSEQAELEGFFELPEGALPEGSSDADALAAWRDALSAASLSLAPDAPGAPAVELPFAGDRAGSAWLSSHALTEAERGSCRLAAFDYADAGAAFDESWQGADPSERLPLRLDLSIPADRLEVRDGLDGMRPITRLALTVSARG